MHARHASSLRCAATLLLALLASLPLLPPGPNMRNIIECCARLRSPLADTRRHARVPTRTCLLMSSHGSSAPWLPANMTLMCRSPQVPPEDPSGRSHRPNGDGGTAAVNWRPSGVRGDYMDASIIIRMSASSQAFPGLLFVVTPSLFLASHMLPAENNNNK